MRSAFCRPSIEASRGLFATAELLVYKPNPNRISVFRTSIVIGYIALAEYAYFA